MSCEAHRGTVLVLATALLSPAAQAHVGVQTVELLAGALHPWINLESALALVALSLWLAQGTTSTDIKPFVTNGLCLAAGIAVGLFLRMPAPPWLIYCVALAAGVRVSLRVKPRPLPWLIAVGWTALLAGYYAGVDAAPDIKTPLVFLLGALAGSFVVPLSIAVVLGARRSRAVQTAIRILGSWIAAISLMMLALRFRA
jgi:hydrogenase/urease accessory protein HupE